MPGKLAAALKRFASQSVQLEEEILKDPDFRLLCEDYGEAVEALQRWSNSRHPMSAQRASEYQMLVWELQKEIQGRLKTHPDC